MLKVSSIVDVDGKDNAYVKQLAFLNAKFESGFANPMDDALRSMENVSAEGYQKADEIPYDFIRKRLSVCVQKENEHILISKGAINNIVEICDKVLMTDGSVVPLVDQKNKIDQLYLQFSNQGFRTIGVCYKKSEKPGPLTKADEKEMIFAVLSCYTIHRKKE